MIVKLQRMKYNLKCHQFLVNVLCNKCGVHETKVYCFLYKELN